MNPNIINQKINYFNGVLDNSCETKVSVKAILEGIRDGVWNENAFDYVQGLAKNFKLTDEERRAIYDDIKELFPESDRKVGLLDYRSGVEKYGKLKPLEEIKKMIPGCTFSGTFNHRRFDNNITHHTGMLVIDIDKKDLTMSYARTIECLKSTPFVFCVFKSTGGEGMKALAYTDQDIPHKDYFKGVEEYLLDEFGIKIDPSGKNVGRLCFISSDPDLYLEFEEKESFTIDKFAPKTKLAIEAERFEEVGRGNGTSSDYEVSNDLAFITSLAVKWAENGVGSYHKGNRNNYIHALACILNRAGVPQHQSEQVVLLRFKSLGQKEVTQTVSSAYTHNKNEFGSRPIHKKANNKQNKII